MNITIIRDEGVFGATINAVIIYDRFDFAAKATALLKRVAQRTDETAHWVVRPWRLDILALPAAAEVALAEAAGAHLILLAMRQVQSLASWLVDWLERWARCRQVLEAALAVWDGGNADTPGGGATSELLQFAGRHGLSLIFDETALIEDKASQLARNLHEREVAVIPTLQHILAQPVRDSYQHWGINE
jgi:hypothetical protein